MPKDQRFEIAHISNSYHGPADSTKGFSYESAVYIADRINQTRHRPDEEAEVFAVDDGHTPTFDELPPMIWEGLEDVFELERELR